MTRAWSISKSGHSFYSRSFSLSLKRAWEVEKEAHIREEMKYTWTPKNIDYSFDMSALSGSLSDYYANNRYNRD